MTTQDISMFFKKARLGPPTLNHGGDRNDAFRGAGEAWPQPKLPQPKPKVPQPKVPQLLTKAKQRCGGKPRASFLMKMEVCAPSHYLMGG
jgi:hypothetical protein